MAGGSWRAGSDPWIRLNHKPSWGRPETGYVQCLFCGEQKAKLSMGDNTADTGRVDVYCDNNSCDAREATILVLRDGDRAQRRADVRALWALDRGGAQSDGEPEQGPHEMVINDLAMLGAQIEDSRRRALDARTSAEPLKLRF